MKVARRRTGHEEVVGREKGVVDLMYAMELAVDPEYFLSSFCDDEVDTIFFRSSPHHPFPPAETLFCCFPALGTLAAGVEFTCEQHRHAEARSVEHNLRLPVIQV